jgi:cell wall-associated NlpC family hydrolase
MVFLNPSRTKMYQKAKQIFLTKDNLPIYSQKGEFLFNSRVGMILALISENNDTYTVLSISSHNTSTPIFLKSIISKEIASKGVLELNQKNLESIIGEFQATNYGWGGIYENRDCSSMIRDIYMPFGIWLPRNSSHQRDVGEIITLEGLSDEEKLSLIKKRAVAFETILYKRGHVVLYVGTYEDEVIVFHDFWGIKTKKETKEGRIIIGKAIFSTLKLGAEQKDYDQESELLKNITSMNIFTKRDKVN